MLFALSLSGCGNKAGKGGRFRDDLGRRITALQPGRGVVSLAPNVTELILWLRGRERLLGVTRFCRKLLPDSGVKSVGSMLSPNLERIVLLKPGMVFLSFEGNTPALASSLRRLSIPGYVIRIQSFPGLLSSIRRLSLVLDLSARKKLERLKKRVALLGGRLSGRRLFFHIPGGRSVFTFGRKTLLADLVRRSGAVNCSDSLSGLFPRVSPERLAALGIHTAVILSSRNSSAASGIRSLWKRVSPGTKLIFSGESSFFRPGPALVGAFADLAARL